MCTFLHVIPPSLASDSEKPSKAATKLFFTAGPRGLRYLAESSRQLSLTSQALGTARYNVADRAGRTEELRREAGSTNEALRKELVRILAAEADRTAAQDKGLTWIHRDQRSTHDFEFLGNVAAALTASDGWQARSQSGGEGVVVLTSAVDGVPGGLLLVQSKDDAAAKTAKDEIAAALGVLADEGAQGKRVRGGGARGRYMCKIEGKFGRREKEALVRVLDNLRESRKQV